MSHVTGHIDGVNDAQFPRGGAAGAGQAVGGAVLDALGALVTPTSGERAVTDFLRGLTGRGPATAGREVQGLPPGVAALARGLERDAAGNVISINGVPVGQGATVEAAAPAAGEGIIRPVDTPSLGGVVTEEVAPGLQALFAGLTELGFPQFQQLLPRALQFQETEQADGTISMALVDSEGNVVQALGTREPRDEDAQALELEEARASIALLEGQLAQVESAGISARATAANQQAQAANTLATFLTSTAINPRNRVIGGANLSALVGQDEGILGTEVGQILLQALGITPEQATQAAQGGRIPGTQITPTIAGLFGGAEGGSLGGQLGAAVPTDLSLRANPRLSAFSGTELANLAPFFELEGTSLADLTDFSRRTASGAGRNLFSQIGR